MISKEQFNALRLINELAEQRNFRCFIVGGVIRDILINSDIFDPDLDLLIEGDAGKLAELSSAKLGGTIKFFPEFLTAKILNPEFGEIDFASTRREVYVAPGALPVVTQADLSSDLGRRDFTINALAIKVSDFINCLQDSIDSENLRKFIIDQFQGLQDLDSATIRVIHDRSFTDDPTRIFRALKYIIRIKGKFDDATEKLLVSALLGNCLSTISGSRIYTELRKISEDPEFVAVIELLQRYGVLEKIFIIRDYTVCLLQLYRLAKLHDALKAQDCMSAMLAVLLLNCGITDRKESLKKLGMNEKKSTAIMERLLRLEKADTLSEFMDFEILVLLAMKANNIIEKEARQRKLI